MLRGLVWLLLWDQLKAAHSLAALQSLCHKKVYWEKTENLGQESRTQTGHGEGSVTTAYG
jgi:hypothetical protein